MHFRFICMKHIALGDRIIKLSDYIHNKIQNFFVNALKCVCGHMRGCVYECG